MEPEDLKLNILLIKHLPNIVLSISGTLEHLGNDTETKELALDFNNVIIIAWVVYSNKSYLSKCIKALNGTLYYSVSCLE